MQQKSLTLAKYCQVDRGKLCRCLSVVTKITKLNKSSEGQKGPVCFLSPQSPILKTYSVYSDSGVALSITNPSLTWVDLSVHKGHSRLQSAVFYLFLLVPAPTWPGIQLKNYDILRQG